MNQHQPSPRLIEKNCKACSRLIQVRLADHKRGWGNFCDKSCAAAYKVGMRPRDVNREHAKSSFWAAECVRALEEAGLEKWPVASPIKEQLGHKLKIKPIYHSPSSCRACGKPVNGPGSCLECEIDSEVEESGWDAHK